MQRTTLWVAAKRRSVRRAATAATAGVVAALVLFATAAASPSQSSLLLLTAKTTTEARILPCHTCVHAHPAGEHLGGVDVQAGDVLDQHGAKVGHFAVWAAVATAFSKQAPGELILDVTLVLNHGQITAHGVELPPDNSGTIVITGGTGSYRSARGELQFTDVNQTTTNLRVTISK